MRASDERRCASHASCDGHPLRTIAGSAGDDRLFGQDGNDSLDGGAGADVLFTGAGSNDVTAAPDVLDRSHLREYRRVGLLLDLHVPVSGRPI